MGGSEAIHVKVTSRIREAIEAQVHKGFSMSESDFVREAIREKLKRNAPELLV